MKDWKECTARKTFASIIEAYKDTREDRNGPQATIDLAVEKCGLEAVREALAQAVNTKSWDGRISPRNADWAASVTDCGIESEEMHWWMPGVDSIHCAHLDQLADVVRQI